MADDIASLIEQLDLKRPDILGYSLGGGVAIQLAIHHPLQVGKLVLISEAMRTDGWYREVNAAFEQMARNAPMIAGNLAKPPMTKMYPDVDWQSLLTKLGNCRVRIMTGHLKWPR